MQNFLYVCCLLMALLPLGVRKASAGPPFITDDPEPTDMGHWEIYTYALGSRALNVTSGQAGFDINYGAYKDLQLTTVLPIAFEQMTSTRFGFGDIEVAAKYRFLHQSDGFLIPDLAIFPRAFIPSANREFGLGHVGFFLPLWAQRDFGEWSVFGGGGYNINTGPGQRGFWQSSVAIQRAFGERMSLGVEIYHQTPDTFEAKPFTGLNLGMTYKLSDHWSLLTSAGPGLQNAHAAGSFDFYIAIKADY